MSKVKSKYFKNKLLFNLSYCAILLCLINSSANAQSRQLTPAEIQKAKSNLRQRINSVKNSGISYYLTDSRTADQKQKRNNLVSVWQQVDPEVAPFVGSWRNNEGAWGIHPSNQKGKVCIINTSPDVSLYDIVKSYGN